MANKKQRNKNKKPMEAQVGQSPVARACKMVIWTALGLAIAYVPLLHAGGLFFPFVSGKALFFMAMSQIAFFAWVILAFHDPQYRPKKNIVLWAVVAFVGVFAISTFLSVDVVRSFWNKFERMTGLLFILHLFAFFITTSSFLRDRKSWEIFVGLSMIPASIVAFMTIGEEVGFFEPLSRRGGATLGNTTFAAVYMLFNAYLALYFFVTSLIQTKNSPKKLVGRKTLFAFTFTLIAIALLVGNARAAMMSFFAGLALIAFAYMAFQARKKLVRKTGIVALAASAITGATALVLVFREGSIVHQWWVRVATEARFVVWEIAWKGFLDRPIFGWGPQAFEMPFYKYFNPCLYTQRCGLEIWFDSSHSIIMDALVTTGIFGLAALVFLIGAAVFVLWKRYFASRKTDEQPDGSSLWLPAVVTVLLAVYVLQGLTIFDTVTSYIMLFVTLAFASAMVGGKYLGNPPAGGPTDKPLVAASRVKLQVVAPVLIVFLFTFIYFVINPYKTGRDIIAAQSLPFGSEQRINTIHKSLNTSPMGGYQIRSYVASFTKDVLDNEEALQNIPKENIDNEVNLAIDLLKEGLDRNPNDIRLRSRLTILYLSIASQDRETYAALAKEQSEKAIETSPGHLESYHHLSQAQVFERDFEAANATIDKAIELEPNYLRSHLFAMNIGLIMQDETLVQQRIDAALEINPEWAEQIQKYLK